MTLRQIARQGPLLRPQDHSFTVVPQTPLHRTLRGIRSREIARGIGGRGIENSIHDINLPHCARPSLAFPLGAMPKKHKTPLTPVEHMRRELFTAAPGLEVLERLMEGADDL